MGEAVYPLGRRFGVRSGRLVGGSQGSPCLYSSQVRGTVVVYGEFKKRSDPRRLIGRWLKALCQLLTMRMVELSVGEQGHVQSTDSSQTGHTACLAQLISSFPQFRHCPDWQSGTSLSQPP